MNCKEHKEHSHTHGQGCGHKAVEHEGHTDYVHDGHLHHQHEGHTDECSLSEATNKTECTPAHKCEGHNGEHKHGQECGHQAVPHSDHVDYMVEGHLHHPCGDHCDDHGKLAEKK
jgi:hypothetical protein